MICSAVNASDVLNECIVCDQLLLNLFIWPIQILLAKLLISDLRFQIRQVRHECASHSLCVTNW